MGVVWADYQANISHKYNECLDINRFFKSRKHIYRLLNTTIAYKSNICHTDERFVCELIQLYHASIPISSISLRIY